MEDHPPDLSYLEGENRCPYRWSTGSVIGAFLTALRDHRKILGAVCSGCGTVWVPPQSYCERCAGRIGDFREVGPRGVVMSWSRVAEPFEGVPLDVPFRYVMVRLAGADTALLHVAPDDDSIRTGAAVRPEYREQRNGSITDIKWFVAEPGVDDD